MAKALDEQENDIAIKTMVVLLKKSKQNLKTHLKTGFLHSFNALLTQYY